MKKLILILIVSLLTFQVARSQTNVSGGIFSNTTWTKANSPYIVTDTVVVFPGITLTIQPGVTVKFDNAKQLEIRQGKLIAVGTVSDSITFTSNSLSPAPGIYSGIYLNGGTLAPEFNYCNFLYAKYAINTKNINFGYTLSVKNTKIISNQKGFECPYLYVKIDSCHFINNTTGLTGDGNISNCHFFNNQVGSANPGNTTLINNCVVESNQLGLNVSSNTTVSNCTIRSNKTGVRMFSVGSTVNTCTISMNQLGLDVSGSHTIKNSFIDSNTVVGLRLFGNQDMGSKVNNCLIRNNGIGIVDSFCAGSKITKNVIENNVIGIQVRSYKDTITCNRICGNTTYDLQNMVSNNINVSNNYWCTSDSASTGTVIYDAYDNINVGIVYFTPIDSICAPGSPTAIHEIRKVQSVSIFPNPFSTKTTLLTDNFLKNATATVYNQYGQVVQQIENLTGSTVTLNRGNLLSGVYFLRLTQDDKSIATVKLIVADN